MPATSARVATLFLAASADALALASAWLGASGEWEGVTLLAPPAIVLTVVATIGFEFLVAGQPS